MKNIILLGLVFTLFSFQTKFSDKSVKVKNQQELEAAIKNAVAGQEIIMANGIWKDVSIKFKAKGSKTEPIVLKAETAGKVFIEGTSDLKIGGSYLEVSGLYFRNGNTPSNSVIEFRADKNAVANNCRVTDCVIENFTQPNRVNKDHWIEFWGRNNQLDHCYITGKSNQGPTIMVILKGNENVNNHHKIVNNHFGPRPRKGGPHGETIQIGDSGTSMTPSYTMVANNYFEKCNGEVEIISNKSNFNEYRNNVFFESEGSLVLRHGNYCTIDGNIFIGSDQSDFMGGVRVVNTGHWITNNYFYKLKGDEFRSALAIMNGVPKSPLNRYNQVTDVVIAHNSFIDCLAPWQFSVGANMDKSDVLPAQEIRSARPDRVVMANNIIYNQTPINPFIKNYDKVTGVSFDNNIVNSPNNSEVKDKGIETKEFKMTKLSDWLFVPTENNTNVHNGFDFENIKTDMMGASRETTSVVGAVAIPVDKSKEGINIKDYGTNWFDTQKKAVAPKTIVVSSCDQLASVLEKAEEGTIIELKKGNYTLKNSLVIYKTIRITSKDKNKVTLTYKGDAKTPAFLMKPFGNLTLENVVLKGENKQYAFATLEKNMGSAYNLWVKNVEIKDFDTVLYAYKDAFADTLSFDHSAIKNCKRGILLADEKEDLGEYNAEFVYITNTTFDGVQSSILDYYRGGYDESTIGGNLVFENNKITNCGSKDEADSILIKTRGIVNVSINKNSFIDNPVTTIALLWGEKGQVPKENSIKNSGEFKMQQNLKQKMMY